MKGNFRTLCYNFEFGGIDPEYSRAVGGVGIVVKYNWKIIPYVSYNKDSGDLSDKRTLGAYCLDIIRIKILFNN